MVIKKNSAVLVTGGAGFLGSHLVEYLVDVGAKVTVIDNLFTGRLDHLQSVLPQIEFINGELGKLLKEGRVELDKFECIFHLAADADFSLSVENPIADCQNNLNTTLMLLEAIRSCPKRPRLIYPSSAAVYGNPARLPIKETDPTVPISPYGVGKLAAERYVAVYSNIYGLQATSLRFFSIYGPRQRKQVIYDLLCKVILNPKRLEVLGDGSQTRDFTYVSDVVKAMFLVAAKAPFKGEVYNVASGKSISIAALVTILCNVCNLSPVISFSGNIRPGDPEEWVVDISNLKKLGFEAKTALEDGLKAVSEWFKSQEFSLS
jgi:UDP-glucose 4-epimerase